jgi:branched-chain amino acid transport system permease protein
MQNFFQILVSGISVGMIYGVIAFGYQLTFATSKTLNFGQGEALTLGALVGLTCVNVLIGLHLGTFAAYLIALPFVFAFGLAQGAVVERLGVRQAMKTKSEAGWIMATIALGIIFKNVAENIWGKDPLKFPSPLSEDPLTIAGVNIRPMEIAIVLGALAMMLAVEAFNRRSIYGKAVVATSNDRDAAGLMGINTPLVITFSYALSSLAAALAGVLIAPITLDRRQYGRGAGPEGLRGRDHRRIVERLGVVVGGLILGITESMTGFYFDTGYKDVPGLILLLLVLSLKPAGLFGKTAIKKV